MSFDSINGSNKRGIDTLGYGGGSVGVDDASTKRSRPNATGPSRVLHVRNLPGDATEAEMMALAVPFGQVGNVMLLKGKNQSFIEMADLDAAIAFANYYTANPSTLRNHTLYVQFSTREHINVPAGNASRGDGANHILLASVSQMLYPVTLDVLHQVFSKYGPILKIATFTKSSNFQALIQFSDVQSAVTAKAALDGQNIYVGCCQLKIQFSNLQNLDIKFNNEKSRDYTNNTLPSGGAGGAAAAASSYANFPVQYVTGGAYDTNQMQYLQGGVDPITGRGCVLIINGLSERVTPEVLFTLIGVYGDVQRVKILYNKKDTALVQMATPQHAETVIAYLNNVVIYGNQLHINFSKHASIHAAGKSSDPNEDNAQFNKDYTNSPLHRYKLLNSKNYQHICAPSATLHVSNIPASVSEQHLRTLFTQAGGQVVGFKYLSSEKKMALVQMSSVTESIEALVSCHDYKFADAQNGLRVSFAKSQV